MEKKQQIVYTIGLFVLLWAFASTIILLFSASTDRQHSKSDVMFVKILQFENNGNCMIAERKLEKVKFCFSNNTQATLHTQNKSTIHTNKQIKDIPTNTLAKVEWFYAPHLGLLFVTRMDVYYSVE